MCRNSRLAQQGKHLASCPCSLRRTPLGFWTRDSSTLMLVGWRGTLDKPVRHNSTRVLSHEHACWSILIEKPALLNSLEICHSTAGAPSFNLLQAMYYVKQNTKCYGDQMSSSKGTFLARSSTPGSPLTMVRMSSSGLAKSQSRTTTGLGLCTMVV